MAYSGSTSFSTDSSGSINSGGSASGSYDTFGTGVVGDTIANQIAVWRVWCWLYGG